MEERPGGGGGEGRVGGGWVNKHHQGRLGSECHERGEWKSSITT